MDIDKLYDETIRLGDVQELADRLVWMWRMTSYRVRCETGTCHMSEDRTPDSTELIINFRDALIRDLNPTFGADPDLIKLAELLSVQTMKRSDSIELQPPEHQWVAADGTDAHCSCGWSWEAPDLGIAWQSWKYHAGPGLELLPWQAAWLEKFNPTT